MSDSTHALSYPTVAEKNLQKDIFKKLRSLQLDHLTLNSRLFDDQSREWKHTRFP